MGDNVQQQGDGATTLSSHRSTGAGTPPSSASSAFKVFHVQVLCIESGTIECA